MKGALFICFLVCLSSACHAAGIADFQSALSTLTRYSGNPIASRTLNGSANLIGDVCVVTNPLNPAETLIFWDNTPLARQTANTSNPTVITGTTFADNSAVISEPWLGPNGPRKGSIEADGTTLYMPYGILGRGPKIGVASSTDGGQTWIPYASNPIATVSTGEHSFNLPVLRKFGATWYLYVSYNNGNYYSCGFDMGTGIKVFTASSPFGPFTRVGEVMPVGQYNYEFFDVKKLSDGTYVMVYESPIDGCSGTYSVRMATATSPTGPFTPYGIILSGSGGSNWDSINVATAGLLFTSDKTYMYYSGSAVSNPGLPPWDGGVAIINYADSNGGGTTSARSAFVGNMRASFR